MNWLVVVISLNVSPMVDQLFKRLNGVVKKDNIGLLQTGEKEERLKDFNCDTSQPIMKYLS